MQDNPKEIEVCCNHEFIRDTVLSPDSFNSEIWGYEAADEWFGEFAAALDDAGFLSVRAKGQRGSFHGWNGANTFTHKGRGWGTFASLTSDEEDTIARLADAAAAAVNANPAFAD